MIPIEIGINSIRVSHYSQEQNEVNLRVNLDLLEEIREEAVTKPAARQKVVAKYFNQRVKPKVFEVGDLVLRNYRASRPVGEHRKLSPTWEGPYLISSVVEKRAYRLQTLEGKEIANTWNAQHLRKYYC